MLFLVVGLLVLVLKMADIGPVADWSWWIVLLPFGLAVAWWAVTDALGIPQRRAMRKLEERTAARRQKAISDLGMGPQGQRRRSSGAAPRDRKG
jgi:small Trp-rich protein